MSSIREQVQERFASLPPVQKGLVQKILSNYEEYVFLTVNEAASLLKVHKSTLVRLAQGLGYEGYAAFRCQLQLLFRQEITPGQKLGHSLADIQEDNLYEQVVETEIQYLTESRKTIRTEDIHRAAQMLLNARRIFVCGIGPQRSLADLIEFRLRRFHFDILAVTEEGRAIFERLQLLEKDDVLMVINYGTFQKDHLDAISIANEVGCPVLLLTETVAKELADGATLILAARRGPAAIYHSNIVPMAIVSAIVLDIARMRAPEVLSSIERLQELRRRYGYTGEPFQHGLLDEEPDDKAAC